MPSIRPFNRLQLPVLAAAPGSPAEGEAYYDSVTKTATIRNGTAGVWDKARRTGYVRADLTADNTAIGVGSLTTLGLTIGDTDGLAWSVVSGISLTPGALAPGMWRATINMFWVTSSAATNVSHRSLTLVGNSSTNKTPLCSVKTHGHGYATTDGLQMSASSMPFDPTAYDNFQLQFYSSTANNQIFKNQWSGPSAIWAVAAPGTYMLLERVT